MRASIFSKFSLIRLLQLGAVCSAVVVILPYSVGVSGNVEVPLVEPPAPGQKCIVQWTLTRDAAEEGDDPPLAKSGRLGVVTGGGSASFSEESAQAVAINPNAAIEPFQVEDKVLVVRGGYRIKVRMLTVTGENYQMLVELELHAVPELEAPAARVAENAPPAAVSTERGTSFRVLYRGRFGQASRLDLGPIFGVNTGFEFTVRRGTDLPVEGVAFDTQGRHV